MLSHLYTPQSIYCETLTLYPSLFSPEPSWLRARVWSVCVAITPLVEPGGVVQGWGGFPCLA